MPWTAERTYVNQRVQVGAESTSALGTPVAATKLLECFDWVMGINADVKFYRAVGHKYDAVQEENTEWVDGTLSGPLDYNGILYPLAGILGSSAVVAHGSSSTAKDWVYTPPTLGSIVPQTYTLQQGDAVRAHQAAYTLFTEFGYKGTRKDLSCSGKFLAQPLSDGITLTSNPTAVALAPVPAKQVNVYLDATSGALGTTQLTRVTSLDFMMTGTYGPLWVFNRANLGWAAHVDLAPKAIMKLKVEADSNGMALLPYLQSGATYYLRVQAQSSATIATDGPGNVYNLFQHDLAIKLNKPSQTFHDDQGVYAIEWELQVVEDPNWGTGKAQQFTITNLLSSL